MRLRSRGDRTSQSHLRRGNIIKRITAFLYIRVSGGIGRLDDDGVVSSCDPIAELSTELNWGPQKLQKRFWGKRRHRSP